MRNRMQGRRDTIEKDVRRKQGMRKRMTGETEVCEIQCVEEDKQEKGMDMKSE